MNKRAMIRNYFWVVHITIKKIIIGNIQPAQDDPGTSPEVLLNKKSTRELTRNPQGTLRGPMQKLMILWKIYFSEVIVLVLHICLCFLQEEQIFNSSKRPRDVSETQLLDVHGTKWWDVLKASVGRRSNMCLN